VCANLSYEYIESPTGYPTTEGTDITTLFRSKVDGKLKAIGVAMPCVALVAVASGPRLATGLLWLPIILTVLVATIVVWVVLSTYYEFEGDLLVAHSGPFSWRIPVKEISGVRESTSVRSGPALSMDRIEIAFGDGRVLLISPADKAGFLAALRRRSPRLTP
jgi:PH (Pleckstrin Homology) domain-containing protein